MNEANNIRTEFSGANTGRGFFSFYDRIFPEDNLTGLYIIKGGSGTGKSTFMRRLGEIARRAGYECEHYLCGSDAESLDGVIIRGKRLGAVGILDGTPPHPREFRSPGAAGDILNFGEFWDSRGLSTRRHEIDRLVKEKSAAFETAYRYLGAAEKIHRHIESLTRSTYTKNKATIAAARIVDSVGVAGEAVYTQKIGFTMNGIVRLSPSGEIEREFKIVGNKDIASLFLSDTVEYIKKKGVSVEISLSPLDLLTVDGVYFPETNVWLHVDDENGKESEKIINTRRFTDREVYSSCRQKIRFGKKCRETLLEGAFESLETAKERHFCLEEIYKEYMDFEALNKQSEIWYSEILSRLD